MQIGLNSVLHENQFYENFDLLNLAVKHVETSLNIFKELSNKI
jgi:hypothetical protein